MAKCSQCGDSSLLLKLTAGICDKCIISNLQHDLSESRNRCRQLESDLNFSKAEINRLSSEKREILLERNQLAACINSSHASSSLAVDLSSDYYSPEGREFKRRITESLSYALSGAERASTLELKTERFQKYIELFDQSADACKHRGSDFANWFQRLYADKHDYRKHACDRLEECTLLLNTSSASSNSSLENLGNILIDIIRSEDGILQRELGKRFDLNVRNHIRNLLYQMEQAGAIHREKSGSSYTLHLVNDGITFTTLTRNPEGPILDEVKYCRFCCTLRTVYDNNVCSVCRHSVW